MTENEFKRSLPLFGSCTGAVLGVSGGPDSMAMLTLFIKERDAGHIHFPFICATLNHGLRPEAGLEVEGVEKYCEQYKVQFETVKIDIPAELPPGESTENFARQRRYAFFENIRIKYGYSHLVTAHNADDNLETVLMNILRGCGTDGLCGISRLRKDNNTVRPLLSVTKAELTAYCEQNGVPYYIDKSNLDTAYRRNYIRNRITPLLREINPSVTEAVNRLCASAGDDCDFMKTEAEKAYNNVLESGGLDIAKLRELHPALLNRAIRLYVASVTGVSASYLDTCILRELILTGHVSDAREVGGRLFRLTYTTLTADKPTEEGTIIPFTPSPGSNTFSGGCLTLTYGENYRGQRNCFTVIPFEQITVRSRRSGDYMHTPQGSGKLLKKLYIDKKIPASIRAALPVLVNGDDVVWAAEIGTAKEFIPGRGSSYIKAEFTLH